MADKQSKSGRKPRVTDEDLLNVFRATTDPVLSTAEVSKQVPIKRRGTLRRLRSLEDSGQLESKQIGGRNTVWWLLDQQNGHSTRVERSEPVDDVSPESTPEPRENVAATQETDEITEQQVKDALEEIDVTGRGAETKEVRRKAILHAWRELREKGEATTQELANSAFDEYADHRKFGYGESSSHYRGYTFWDSCARDVFKQLPGVESPPQRGNTWYFNEGEA